MEEKNFGSNPHSLVLENRKHLTVSGVKDVDSFDEQNIIAESSLGEIHISGSGLKIIRFSNETGELSIDGDINGVVYSDVTVSDGGFFARIFR